MKKFWITGLSLLLALSFTACAKNPQTSPAPSQQPEEGPKEETTTTVVIGAGAPA